MSKIPFHISEVSTTPTYQVKCDMLMLYAEEGVKQMISDIMLPVRDNVRMNLMQEVNAKSRFANMVRYRWNTHYGCGQVDILGYRKNKKTGKKVYLLKYFERGAEDRKLKQDTVTPKRLFKKGEKRGDLRKTNFFSDEIASQHDSMLMQLYAGVERLFNEVNNK